MSSRLKLALEADFLRFGEAGTIGYMNAGGSSDFGGVDAGRIVAQTHIYPTAQALSVRGVRCVREISEQVSACIVQCHRSKLATLDLLRRAFELTEPGGLVILDGNKTDGVESALKSVKSRFELDGSYSKAHGKLAWVCRPETLPDLTSWSASPRIVAEEFTTFAGVFSAEKIDTGSQLLADHLPPLSGRVIDLGAGWGYLARRILKNPSVEHLLLADADALALQAAELNIDDARAEFLWCDARTLAASPADVIVSNPPFHAGRVPDPGLGQAFIETSARLLKPKGSLWMVANRGLPYEETLNVSFGRVEPVAQTRGFKIIHATNPKTARKR
ncbi:MAG: methyltransferase [Pseudomonadota bacterium]